MAGALLIFVSRTEFEHNDQPSPSNTYDTGAAWMSLALQASIQGLVAHGMAGFDYAKARNVAGLTDVYKVEAMAAIGKPGDVADLPEAYQSMDVPSSRKTLEEIMFNGALSTD